MRRPSAPQTHSSELRSNGLLCAIRATPVGDRLGAFLDEHPNWPARDYLLRRIEDGLYQSNADSALIANFFDVRAPQTALGKLAKARALRSDGKDTDAEALVRDVWRHSTLPASLETHVRAEFGAYLSPADYKARADRLLYEGGQYRRAAQRSAGKSGLCCARQIACCNQRTKPLTTKCSTRLPPDMRADPAFLFARIHKLRHEDKLRDGPPL